MSYVYLYLKFAEIRTLRVFSAYIEVVTYSLSNMKYFLFEVKEDKM